MPTTRSLNEKSLYTLTIALNNPKNDYEGATIQFPRYNCSISDTKKGFLFIHPGKLTHYYEQEPVTKGTKYVAVTHVDG